MLASPEPVRAPSLPGSCPLESSTSLPAARSDAASTVAHGKLNRTSTIAAAVLPRDSVVPQMADDMVRSDGRNRRAAETRRKIIQAAKAMIAETSEAPTVVGVARRADVSVRSVFQHFRDVVGIVNRLQPAPRHRFGFVPRHTVTRLAQQVADQPVLVPAVGGARRCGRDIGGMMDDGDHAA